MRALPRWGVVCTLKAELKQVQAFVAHHLSLGASRIWLHFDDPDDPALPAFKGVAKVVAIRCDDAYWAATAKERPPTHQMRQIKNCTRVLRRAQLDFIAHIDVDEFLIAPHRPVAEILAECPPEQLLLRVEPWEALYTPGLSDDIFTARYFRRQLPLAPHEARALYGPQGPLLERGMLSHTVGKCLFRTGIAGMIGHIHGARIEGVNVPGGAFHPELALLHFHAEDQRAWTTRLPFRLAQGAYQYRPAMREWLMGATAPQIAQFYQDVQTASPELLQALQNKDAVREVDLSLRTKCLDLFGAEACALSLSKDARS